MADYTKHVLCLPACGMDLAATLFCGQSFSWQSQADGRFCGVVGARAALAWQEGDTLYIKDTEKKANPRESEAFWRQYFAQDIDYAALQKTFSQDENLARMVAAAPGLRVLRQPFFETLLSFIISQNNHIPRIYGIVQRLCAQHGAQISGAAHAFPTAAALAGLETEDLAPLRAGFRARYLLDAAQKVANGSVCEDDLRQMDKQKAKKALCGIVGVGPKVADCVLLFALQHWDTAPMDVWMKRAVVQYFGGDMPECSHGAQGIAQQYIFHWMRTQKNA